MEWTRDMTLMLIEEYQKRRGLWDMTHEDYRKKDIKKELLDQVSQKFERKVPPIEIEKKFHTLRTQYHREINRMQQTRGNKNYKSKWFAFKHLQFLSSPKACRASKSTMKIKIESDPYIGKSNDSDTKIIFKEVPMQTYSTTSANTHTLHAELLNSEKSCDEEAVQQNNIISIQKDNKRKLENLFEETSKNVEEQIEGKLIIKEINVPVHSFGGTTTEHKVVASTTFPSQQHHHHQQQQQQQQQQHQDVEEQCVMEGSNSNHENLDDNGTEYHQNGLRMLKTSTTSLQKRDSYDEILYDEEQTPNKKAFYDKSSPIRDEYGIYGEYIANELRFITSRDILIQVKHKINTAIFEASMAQIHKNN